MSAPPPRPTALDRTRLAHALDRVESFLRRFVVYPSDAAPVAHALWVAHTHTMGSWESTPRIAFLSPEPGSGKSRALEVSELLVPNPVHAINTSPAYLFRKVSAPDGLPTILFDEIDTIFGPKAKDNEDLRGMLNAGHRRGAMAGRCVVRGNTIETEELPAFCAVALAGLNDLPDTLATRSVIVRMRRRAPNEDVEPFRHRVHRKEGNQLRDELAELIQPAHGVLRDAWPDMPDGIADRNADVWEALLAVADHASGHWPETARWAAVTLVQSLTSREPSLSVRLLLDIRRVFTDRGDPEGLSTVALISALVELEESPWSDLRGKPLDARALSRMLGKYEVRPEQVWTGDANLRGYKRADLWDAWQRYLPLPSADESARSARSADDLGDLADLADLHPHERGGDSETDDCQVCGQRLFLRIPGRTVCAACEKRAAS